MENYKVLKGILPQKTMDELTERALSCFSSVKNDYWEKQPEKEFQIIYQEIGTVARCISVRFFNSDTKSLILKYLLPEVEKLYPRSDFQVCPLFTLRWYHPGLFISSEHESTYLQTEPHYDNAFNNYGISVWVPFHDIDESTGGLCFFKGSEIEKQFPRGGKNRYNFYSYLEECHQIDPLLKDMVILPEGKLGDIYIHSNALHAATKPLSEYRLSFNFRLIPQKQLQDKAQPVQDLYYYTNKETDFCNALNLAHLGDKVGASSLYKLQKNNPLFSADHLQFKEKFEKCLIGDRSLSQNKIHWRDEFSWILND